MRTREQASFRKQGGGENGKGENSKADFFFPTSGFFFLRLSPKYRYLWYITYLKCTVCEVCMLFSSVKLLGSRVRIGDCNENSPSYPPPCDVPPLHHFIIDEDFPSSVRFCKSV